MTFVAGQVLTAAQLNALDITSLTVDTDTLVVDATNDRVGINTASPSVALDVGGSVVIDDDLTVDTSTLKVDSANNRVGIGTASPVAGLDVATTGGATWTTNGWDSGLMLNAASALRWRTASGVDWGIGNSGSTLYFMSSTDSGTGAAADYRMVIASDGDVGIGTTSPGAQLHVNAGTVNNVASFESTDAGALISLMDNSTTGSSYVGLRADGNELNLRAGNANRVRVDASGNVGIGTTTPTEKLDVDGNLRIRTGVDGGIEFRPWTASSSYNSMANTNHTGAEYTMLTTASATFISVGTGGSVNIRPNGNEVSGLSVQTTGTFIIAKFPGVSGYLTVRRRSSDGLLGYASSSQRYKENIVDADDTWRQIYDLRPRDFDWRESMFDTDPDGVPDDRSDYGLIAEEAHLVMPSIVDWAVPNVETEVDEHNEPIPPETPPDPVIESVDYEKLSRYFLPAIQDLNARLTTLESA